MNGKLVKRSDVKAFYGVPGAGSVLAFTRMRGFTELSTNKNPKEYSRQYVDEAFETTDVTGYSVSMNFAFDKYTDDPVLSDMASIIDDEKTGTEAQRDIVIVDFTKESGGGFEAKKRTFAVIADTTGNSTDAMTYNGTFKVVSKTVKGIATIATPDNGDSETVETISFSETVSE